MLCDDNRWNACSPKGLPSADDGACLGSLMRYEYQSTVCKISISKGTDRSIYI
jgi:hypothetical protein